MNRISRLDESKILDLHFQGLSREAIAERIGVAPSTVSEVIGILPESLLHLRELSIELTKRNISVYEAKRGTELRARLEDLGVKFEKMGSFVESAEKILTNPDYEPKQIVQGAMKLNELEKSGKTYPEALVDFEKKTNSIKKLDAKEHELTEKVKMLETEKKRRLAENNVTEKEIDYTVNLRQNLSKHCIKLDDAENLKKYLRNLQEVGGSPEQFVEFTNKHGSFGKSIALLEQKEFQEKLNLQRLNKEEQNLDATISIARSTKSELDKQVLEQQNKLTSLQERERQIELRTEQKLAKLSALLLVEPEAEKVVGALGAKQKELEKINAEIPQERNRLQNLWQNVQELEREIQDKLEIDNYVTQLKTGIAALENRKLTLEKEADKKQAKIAIADTITAFLTKQAPYDFNRFYSYIEQIKMLRESGKYSTSIYLTIAEEQTRMLALEAFKGLLATTAENSMLKYNKEMSDKAKTEAEAEISQLRSKLEALEKEKQFLEALKVNFEGQPTTISELGNWVVSTYWQEIEKKADERFNTIAAGTCGALEYVAKIITSRFHNQRSGQQ